MNMTLINNKKYIVLEKDYFNDWSVIRESKQGISEEDAIEICNYWIKYDKAKADRLKIIEVSEVS